MRETRLNSCHSAPCRHRGIIAPALPGREPSAPLLAVSGTAPKGKPPAAEKVVTGFPVLFVVAAGVVVHLLCYPYMVKNCYSLSHIFA